MNNAFVAVLVAGLVVAGCGGEDTGGAIDSGGTAPLRQGVTTTVAPGGGVKLTATLAGASEVPGPGDPDGKGTAMLTLTPDGKVCASITVAGIDEATAAHIHTGAANLAGPVFITLPTPKGGAADACVSAAATQVADVLANPAAFYVNVHTAAQPAGALRGQLARA